MTRLITITITVISWAIFSSHLSAQIVKLNEEVTEVHVIDNKVTFIKEIPRPAGNNQDQCFRMMKDWAIRNYGKDPFISSVRTDAKTGEIIAKSRIELLLPEDSKQVRERFVMRYRVNGYVLENYCVLEVTDISFLYQGVKKEGAKALPKVIRAEAFITNDMIEENSELQEIRRNVRKSTLYFVNELYAEFESSLGYTSSF